MPPKKRLLKYISLVILGLLLALLVGCTGTSKKDEVSVGDEAPPFTLTAADGSRVSLSDYRGKTEVLLYFNMAYG